MPFCIAIAATDTPGSLHCLTRSRLYSGVYVRRPVRLMRTPLTEPVCPVVFLVSTFFIVDTIFGGDQNRFKTVLG